jgi:hypothetical protein
MSVDDGEHPDTETRLRTILQGYPDRQCNNSRIVEQFLNNWHHRRWTMLHVIIPILFHMAVHRGIENVTRDLPRERQEARERQAAKAAEEAAKKAASAVRSNGSR